MRAAFRPGFTIVNYEYDNPSSGGQIIVTPGDPNHSYYDPATGRIYMHMDGEGWYYLLGDELVFVGPNLDVSGMEEQ